MKNIILKKILSIKKGIGICWLGNVGWLLYSNNYLIAFDLDLDSDIRIKKSPVTTEELAPVLDIHFITHNHNDHFNEQTSELLAKISNCLFVLPSNCLEKSRAIGIPDSHIKVTRPGNIFDLDELHVQTIRAIHGHKDGAICKQANINDCGYVLTFGNKKILQPGDSVLLEEHLSFTDVNVLFISPTEHNTHIKPSALLINTIKPNYIFPQHYDTYKQTKQNTFWTKGYPSKLKTALAPPMKKRFYKLKQGEVFIIK